MVIGSGLIASAFINDYGDDPNFIVFAAGVSNSTETNPKEFEREEKLLIKTISENKGKHILYFSSFIDNDVRKRKYVEHKRNIENIIKKSKLYYTILKLPQAVGFGGNKNTLVNFFVDKLKSGEEIDVYKNVYKGLVDVEDIKKIVDVLVKKWSDKNTYIELPYIEKLPTLEIVNLIAAQLGVEPKTVLHKGELSDLPQLSLVGGILIEHIGVNPNGYTKKIIEKYVK